jgi:sugar/nucleoside kinase (ribokinase family)
MKKFFDVAVVGELNVDLILNQINKFPEVGKEVLADQMTITLGSSSAIFASNLSVLGSKVTFVGTLGRDHFGDHVVSSLQSKGVHTDNIIYCKDCSTGATVVLNYQEDRANVTYPGAMSRLSIKDISDESLQYSKHLHVSSIFLSTGLKKDIRELFKKAKGMGLTTSLDPQWDPGEQWDIDFKALLPYVDIFMPNENELRAMTRTRDVREAVQALKPFINILVVKSGNKGACLWIGDEIIQQPAFLNKEVVDSIGAGDSFDAGFIHTFLQQKTLKECLEFGALTGAINTTKPGGTAAFESLPDIKAIAATSFNHIIL